MDHFIHLGALHAEQVFPGLGAVVVPAQHGGEGEQQDGDGNELSLIDLLCSEEDSVINEATKSIEREKFIKFVKSNLSKREFIVLSLRYGLKDGRSYAQREVAKMLKISRSYISRIEKKAIEKLKICVKNLVFDCL